QDEMVRGHGLEHEAHAPAARAIAADETFEIGAGGKAHGPALAASLVILHFGSIGHHWSSTNENKHGTCRRMSQAPAWGSRRGRLRGANGDFRAGGAIPRAR